jgi:hypothetical protein
MAIRGRRHRKAAAARCRNRLLISPSKRSVVGVVEEMVKQKLVTLIVPSLSSTSSAGSDGSTLRDFWGPIEKMLARAVDCSYTQRTCCCKVIRGLGTRQRLPRFHAGLGSGST